MDCTIKDEFEIKQEQGIKEEPEDLETKYLIIELEHIFKEEPIKEEYQENLCLPYQDAIKLEPQFVHLYHTYARPPSEVNKTFKAKKRRSQPCEVKVCGICNEKFVRVNTLEKHLLSHSTSGSPFKCDICGATFKWKKNMCRHILTLHSDPIKIKFPCKICGKFFHHKYLGQHERTHNILNEKPSFKCQVCGKCFILQQYLTTHIRRHKEKKAVPCPVCGKSFSGPEGLRIHKRVHTGEKPYLCSICGAAFRARNTLYIHQSVHWTGKNFPCDLCDAKFKNPNCLGGHKRKVHGPKNVPKAPATKPVPKPEIISLKIDFLDPNFVNFKTNSKYKAD